MKLFMCSFIYKYEEKSRIQIVSLLVITQSQKNLCELYFLFTYKTIYVPFEYINLKNSQKKIHMLTFDNLIKEIHMWKVLFYLQ